MVYRFGSLSSDPLPLQYAEAAWAGSVDWRYAKYYEMRRDWHGPVRGPLALAVAFMVDVLNRVNQQDLPEISAASIVNLGRHVIAKSEPFNQWFDWAIKRLEDLFPRDPEDPIGPAVPREALNPDLAFQVDQTEELINRFLTDLDIRSNPFLSPPAKMLDEGFEGTPYLFSMAEDRKHRMES
jgi:hypothetical protein